MGDTNRRRLTHRLTELCFILNVIFATGQFPQSPNGCSLPSRGITYIGSLNITLGGKPCQNWIDNQPQEIDSQIADNMFPDRSKAAARNFCRNPTPSIRDGIWCYTMDDKVEWDYCNYCPGDTFEPYSGCSLKDKGARYKGELSHTLSLSECQAWSDHPNNTFVFVDGNAEKAQNYCRNPDSKHYEAPWCYIAEDQGITWEYCDICRPISGRVEKQTGIKGVNGTSTTIAKMGGLACVRLCLVVGVCLGVDLKDSEKECGQFSTLENTTENMDNWDIYMVQRVCDPKAKGNAGFFVDNPGVLMIETTNSSLVASEADCDKHCIEDKDCIGYYRNSSNGTCVFHSNAHSHMIPVPMEIRSRYLIRCEPSAQPYEDVALQLSGLASQSSRKSGGGKVKSGKSGAKVKSENSGAEVKSENNTFGSDVFAKADENEAASKEASTESDEESDYTYVYVIVAVLAVAIVGFAYYKLIYLKRKEAIGDPNNLPLNIGDVQGKKVSPPKGPAAVKSTKGERAKLKSKKQSTSKGKK